jgi:glycosyltransferase involved in cell wall biosynthesis
MKAIIIGGLSDDKFLSKVEPFLANCNINRVYLFRSRGNNLKNHPNVYTFPLSDRGAYPKGPLPRLIFDLYNLIGCLFVHLFSKVDIIVGIYLYPHGFYASLLGKILNIPVVLILPGTDLKKYLETRKNHTLLGHSAFWGVRGSNSMQQLINIGHNKKNIFVLHNVFDFNKYLHPSKMKTRKVYDLVFTGYLRPMKRLDVLLNIILLLKKKGHTSVNCLIVGDGPEKNKLVKLASVLGISHNVAFKPYTKPIKDVLYPSKIFIMTSESEGLPMSMIEAMACGLPVVVSNINDIPDIVDHGENGYLVEPLNVESYAFYLDVLLKDESFCHKMGQAAYSKIKKLHENDFSFEHIKKKWETIIDQIKGSQK